MPSWKTPWWAEDQARIVWDEDLGSTTRQILSCRKLLEMRATDEQAGSSRYLYRGDLVCKIAGRERKNVTQLGGRELCESTGGEEHAL